MSDIDIPIIEAFEGLLKPIGGDRYTAYLCPAHVVTIGLGTTRDDVPSLQMGDVWTGQKCREVFEQSLGKYGDAVDRAVAGRKTPLVPHQWGALRSATYNCGPKVLAGNVGRAVREGRDADVPMYLARWNKGGGKVLSGLVRRRKAEGLLYQGKIAEAYRIAEATVPGTMPQSREVPAPTTADLARAMPKSTAAIAAGTTTAVGSATGGGTTPEQITSTAVLVGFGIVVAIIAVVVFIRRGKALREDWA